jgi:hypothetical protein
MKKYLLVFYSEASLLPKILFKTWTFASCLLPLSPYPQEGL